MKTNQKSVVVVDRAICNTYLNEDYKRPKSSWNKAELDDTIYRWDGIPNDWSLPRRTRKTKNELLDCAK